MTASPVYQARQATQLLGGVQRVHTRVRGFAPWSSKRATLALLDQVQRILDEYVDHRPAGHLSMPPSSSQAHGT